MRRLKVYRAYFDRLHKMNAQDPKLREGLHFLAIDGSAQPTSFTCPVYDKSPDGGKTRGPLLNASRITRDEGTTMSNDVPVAKQSMGFGVVPLTCINALPWAYVAAHRRCRDADRGDIPTSGPGCVLRRSEVLSRQLQPA